MILAIDTATRQIGIGLYDGSQVQAEIIWRSNNYHTVELAPAIYSMFARVNVSVQDLSAVGVSIGPGSFTGLRIGLALAKGMAYPYAIPIIGIGSLDILAAAQPQRSEPMAAVLQAGRGRLAVGWYSSREGAWNANGELQVCTPEELSASIQSPTYICGELHEDERRLFARKRVNIILASPANSLRRPSFLAELAWMRLQKGEVSDPATLSPVYLHHHDPIPE
jgi:tRNA threonylcarbamoyladenosine biosynthesis protein TsaB